MNKEPPKISVKQAVIVDDLLSISVVMSNLQIMYAQQQSRVAQLKVHSDPVDFEAAEAYVRWQTQQITERGATHPIATQEQ